MKKAEKKAEQVKLAVEERKVLGKKVKKLRKEGVLPGNIFGTDFKSTAISVKQADFIHVYKIVHETGIVYLQLDKKDVPTLVKHIQRHPIDSSILHIDFRKIDLTQKIETEVPVKVIGTSDAVAHKGGVLLNQSTHLTVEALPQDIPGAIEIDISSLKELGMEIKVKDLPQNKAYTVKTEPEKVIVSVTAHKEESVVAETTAAAAPEVITAKPETEGEAAAGAVPAAGKAEAAPAADAKAKEPAKK